ncbi:MAG: dihydrofolate reductase family protein [Chitinophagaceae bacterium]
MRKVISFLHISLDGFVAGPNGELDWASVDQSLFEYVGKRISKGDTAIYGRATYDLMESYWPSAADQPNATQHTIEHSKWYKNVRKIVLSTSAKDNPANNTTVVNNHLSDQINLLKKEPGEEILIFGSPTATQSLMKQGLVDGFWLFLNPVILGKGKRLFEEDGPFLRLKQVSVSPIPSGVIELNYLVERI